MSATTNPNWLLTLYAIRSKPLAIADIVERFHEFGLDVEEDLIRSTVETMQHFGLVTTWPVPETEMFGVQITKQGVQRLLERNPSVYLDPSGTATDRAARFVDRQVPRGEKSQLRQQIINALDIYDPNGPGAKLPELYAVAFCHGYVERELRDMLQALIDDEIIRWKIPVDGYVLTPKGQRLTRKHEATPTATAVVSMTESALHAWWHALDPAMKAKVHMEYFESLAAGKERDEVADREVCA